MTRCTTLKPWDDMKNAVWKRFLLLLRTFSKADFPGVPAYFCCMSRPYFAALRSEYNLKLVNLSCKLPVFLRF